MNPTPHRTPSSTGRIWVFRIVMVLMPVGILAAVEWGLRMADYGPDLEVFRGRTIGGREYLEVNPDVTGRYFPLLRVTAATADDLFDAVKREGALRVFALGASSTLGYPYMYNGSFPAILRDALRERFPDRHIEVINLGVTAVTSYTVREFAMACLEHRPDAIIIYAGHNEYYGALGVSSTERIGGRWTTDLYLRLLSSRTFLALRDALAGIRNALSSEGPASGTLMEQLAGKRKVPFGSQPYREGIETYEENIRSVLSAARAKGVPVVLSTLVSNLRDLPPLGSEFSASTGEEVKEEIVRALETGPAGSVGLERLSALFTMDTMYAQTAYAIGRAHDQARVQGHAVEWYTRARDYDVIRFRASTELNATIVRLSGEFGTTLARPDSVFAAVSHGGVPGNDLLLEHVHPNLTGYELLARTILAELMTALDLPRSGESGERPLRVLVTPIDSIAAAMRIDVLVNSWPFTTSRRSVSDLTAGTPEEALALGFLREEMTWEMMHVQMAESYERRGNWIAAALEYEALAAATPYNVSPFLRLGDARMKAGDRVGARAAFERSLKVEETSVAYLRMSQLDYEDGAYDAAVGSIRKALAVGGVSARERGDVRLSLAAALARSGRGREAIDELGRLLAEQPDHQGAIDLRKRLEAEDARN